MAPLLELFPFRYRDERTGKWVRARYVAELREIAARYAEWETTEPAEIRDIDPGRALLPSPCRLGPWQASTGQGTAEESAA